MYRPSSILFMPLPVEDLFGSYVPGKEVHRVCAALMQLSDRCCHIAEGCISDSNLVATKLGETTHSKTEEMLGCALLQTVFLVTVRMVLKI